MQVYFLLQPVDNYQLDVIKSSAYNSAKNQSFFLDLFLKWKIAMKSMAYILIT